MVVLATICLSVSETAHGASVIAADANTLIVSGSIYRLEGVDAPDTDQRCIDVNGKIWTCGIAARDELAAYVGSRHVRCDRTGVDSLYRKRHVAICWVDDETISLNQWLVREGWALNFEPSAKGRFKSDERQADAAGKGLWKGCFVAPQTLRRWSKPMAKLLGKSCPPNDDWEVLGALFPDHPVMPAGCSIKGKLVDRASITGHRGIYQVDGCFGYARLKTPDRWFCSEQEAQAEGYRKALTCPKSATAP
jgi:endonuclease YncB( thermonuclease family)